jgi:hypothetical protein
MNYRLAAKILFFVLTFTIVEAKVTIFSRYFGQPQFIKYQYEFFKKNLLDEYDLIVVEESNDPLVSAEIINECTKYDIKYIRIPRSEFAHPKLPIKDCYVGPNSPSFECCVAFQYIYDHYIVRSENICLIVDNDIFLLSPCSVEKYLGSASFAYVHQSRGVLSNYVYYMLPNFLILNPSRMPEKERLDFNMGTILGTNTDSGGYTYFYLRDYENLGREISIHYLFETPSLLKAKFADRCPLLFTSDSWRSHYFIEKEAFLHIRMGSNWSNNPLYPNMINEVTFLFDQLLCQR